MRKHRYHRKKTRVLWDGKYKPYYEINSLEDFNVEDHPMDIETFTRNWWGFLDARALRELKEVE